MLRTTERSCFGTALLLAVFPIGFGLAGLAFAQERPAALERYDKVCEALFPRDESYPREFSVTLRFLPSFAPESQIQIIRVKGGYRVIHTHLASGSKTIWEQMAEFSERTGSYRVEDIAAAIKVRQDVISTDSSVFGKIMDDLKKATTLSEESLIIMDGTRYGLWFANAGETFRTHFSFSDEDLGAKRFHHPLARWMNRVKEFVVGESGRTQASSPSARRD